MTVTISLGICPTTNQQAFSPAKFLDHLPGIPVWKFCCFAGHCIPLAACGPATLCPHIFATRVIELIEVDAADIRKGLVLLSGSVAVWQRCSNVLSRQTLFNLVR